MTILMDVEALNAFLIAEFPQVTGEFRVRSVTPLDVVVEMLMTDAHLRPGGTVSGPTMFALADVSVFLAILARIGPVGLAVTTNASIDFMRKPVAGKTLIATARILKLGRVLAVGDVLIQSEGQEAPVARASMTYSIPPNR
ncbi:MULTISPECIES: PaaI family thioesterase [Falsihalocynthiibacter]|uniref:PaaI family thioesterase n=1 Tax=Falsihalocynthiibacter TaxID=2854182 RepID=UPI0030031FB2